MVDPDVLDRKSAQVRHHVARLQRRLPLTGEVLAADEDLWNTVLMDLVQAIQACIDLAVHTVVDSDLGTPEGPASAFAILAQAGVLAEDVSIRLASAAGLRNIIVHRYGDLRYDRVAHVIANDLVFLERFVKAVRSLRSSSSD